MTFDANKKRQPNQRLLCWIAVGVFCLSSLISVNGFLSPRSTARAGNRGLSASDSSTSLNYKKVFVAGGSNGVGHLVVEKLSQQGTEVVALVRREDAKEELDAMEGVTAILGDAFDQKDVENAMDGCDVAITTLGGKTGERRVDYEGNNNVIESAGILGVQRILLVTSIGWYVSQKPPWVGNYAYAFEYSNNGMIFSPLHCFLPTEN